MTQLLDFGLSSSWLVPAGLWRSPDLWECSLSFEAVQLLVRCFRHPIRSSVWLMPGPIFRRKQGS